MNALERILQKHPQKCAYCGEPIAIRNKSRDCDHLYWPELLTDEAKRANGYVEVAKTVWEKP